MLTLATALKSVNLINKQLDETLNKDVIKTMTSELRACEDTECTVAVLHALGNAANLRFTLNTLEKTALDFLNKREAIAAMKAIRDSLESDVLRAQLDSSHIIRLRALAVKVAFDGKQETTSRIIAAEIIAKYLNDEHLAGHLVSALASFKNNEMATLMWKKALKESLKTSEVTALVG